MEKICIAASIGVALFATAALFFGYAAPPAALAKTLSHTATSAPTHLNGSKKDILELLGTRERHHPVRVVIPSAGINSPITPVGINTKGELAVPSGKTNEVGWWKGGPVPGETGGAVLAAHLYAAFSTLKHVEPGDAIFVDMGNGVRNKFTVSKTRTYKLEHLDSDTLFGNTGSRELRLITCAGERTADGSTYTKRLVVYARYVGTA